MSLFKLMHPLFKIRVQESRGGQEVMRTLGIEIARLEPEEITLTMPYAAASGFVHAGIDGAALSLMPEDAGILTVEFKLNLLAPAGGDCFVFRGKVVKPGGTLTDCEAQAFAISRGEQTLIATMSGTLMALFDRGAIRSQ